MPRSNMPGREDHVDEFENETYEAAFERYASGESDLADAADRAGLSRWEFVERLREIGVEPSEPSSELV